MAPNPDSVSMASAATLCEGGDVDKKSAIRHTVLDAHVKDIYKQCTLIEKPSFCEWFSLLDCVGRAIRLTCSFYIALILRPYSFVVYTYKYWCLHASFATAVAYTVSLPYLPWVVFMKVVFLFMYNKADKLVRKLLPRKSTGTARASIWDTNIFFIPPESHSASIVWSYYKELHMFVGGFFLAGKDAMGIQASYCDDVTNKHYWRDLLRDNGARVPEQLAEWNGKELKWLNGFSPESVANRDVVLKLHNSYLGIGDRFLEAGKDFTSGKDLESLIRAKYPASSLVGEPVEADDDDDDDAGVASAEDADSEVPTTDGALIVMDWVRPLKGIEPAPSLDVHQLDILTLRVPGEGVQVVSVIYWGDCTTATTHSARSGFVCDLETETIMAKAEWYGPYFSSFTPKPDTIGRKIPGMAESVALAVKAHENIELPFLAAVGWDVMITKDGPVFFEGNYGISRMPRRMFLNWTNWLWTMRRYALGPPPLPCKPKSA